MTISTDDLFHLTNLEDHPLRWTVYGKTYSVAAGQTIYVPFDLVSANFGDPRSGLMERSFKDEQGNRMHIPSRQREIKRLTTWYGYEQKIEDLRSRAVKDGVPLGPLPTLADGAPKVKITDQAGNEIKTVLDDPEGHAAVEPVSTLDSPEAIKAEVARQRAVLERLEAAQEAANNAPTADGEEVTEDTPDLPKGK